jgi:spermidine synthase
LRNGLPPFLLGLLATSFQILLLREFSAYFYGNELSFGIVLAAWLLWGGLGSIVASKKGFRLGLPRLYYLVIGLLPLSLLAVRFSRFILHLLPGEVTGLTPILLLSFVLCLLINFPLGALFVENVRRMGGNIPRVYILESLGAAAAGPIVYALLLPLIPAWLAAAIISAGVAILVFISTDQKSAWPVLLLLLIYLGGFSLSDLPSQRIYWRPYRLIAGADTRYGKLQVIQTQEEVSLYSNGSRVYSYPDPAAAEESVHFALLQNPAVCKVLLIGGGAGGTVGELLKYPRVHIDYVELDPEIIRLSQVFLDEQEIKNLSSERVHQIFDDGRAFLLKTREKYDFIILNLPAPSTAQINRFYTREFFLLAKKHLVPTGILSFPVASAENYISPDLQQFLSSLDYTLKSVFPEVKVVPGDRNIFLASARPILLDPGVLGQRIKALGLQTTYLNPAYLSSRLHPLRRQYLEEKIAQGGKRVNSDLNPISFFFHSVLWNAQFGGIESTALRRISKIPLLWLLGIPLLLFFLLLSYFRVRKKRAGYLLTPLAVMGMTTITIEIVVLVWFQALYGYLYGRIALLLSTFMLGLFLGSAASARAKAVSFKRLATTQFGFALFLLLFRVSLGARPPEVLAFVFLLFIGGLGGDLFIIANRLYLQEKRDYGLGYGLDLAGSFLGALVTASLLIPLAGLPRLLDAVFILNTVCFLFLLARPKRL